MPHRKMNEKEWAMYIELQKRNKEMRAKLAKKENNLNKLRKYMFSSWVFGVSAAIIMYFFYGWEILLETILSWTIGVTIIATIFAAITKNNKKGRN